MAKGLKNFNRQCNYTLLQRTIGYWVWCILIRSTNLYGLQLFYNKKKKVNPYKNTKLSREYLKFSSSRKPKKYLAWKGRINTFLLCCHKNLPNHSSASFYNFVKARLWKFVQSSIEQHVGKVIGLSYVWNVTYR